MQFHNGNHQIYLYRNGFTITIFQMNLMAFFPVTLNDRSKCIELRDEKKNQQQFDNVLNVLRASWCHHQHSHSHSHRNHIARIFQLISYFQFDEQKTLGHTICCRIKRKTKLTMKSNFFRKTSCSLRCSTAIPCLYTAYSIWGLAIISSATKNSNKL